MLDTHLVIFILLLPPFLLFMYFYPLSYITVNILSFTCIHALLLC
jgi:hypothetical protein